jgi:hypothetical protein
MEDSPMILLVGEIKRGFMEEALSKQSMTELSSRETALGDVCRKQ